MDESTPLKRPRDEEALLKEALGGIEAPPGLRERIRAALDEEDGRRVRGTEGRILTFVRRHTTLLTTLAASFLLIALLPLTHRGSGNRLDSPAAGGEGAPSPRTVAVVPVRLQGVVVCYDCAREGASLDYQATVCQWPNHTNGLKAADGSLARFFLADRAGTDPLYSRSMRGRTIRVEGDLYPAVSYLHVKSYVELVRCHAPARPPEAVL